VVTRSDLVLKKRTFILLENKVVEADLRQRRHRFFLLNVQKSDRAGPLTSIRKRGKRPGGGSVLGFPNHLCSDSFWEWRFPETSTGFRTAS
jgi:hypothetical protein